MLVVRILVAFAVESAKRKLLILNKCGCAIRVSILLAGLAGDPALVSVTLIIFLRKCTITDKGL